MSATIEKPPTKAERAVMATAKLREIFGFEDLKAMSTAVAEVAAEEARANTAFANRVRAVYGELAQKPKPSKASPRPKKGERPNLVPIGTVEGPLPDPFAPVDPYRYLKLYGAEQLPIAFNELMLTTLKDIAKHLMADHPGTKPASMAKKDAVIAYIVETVTGK